MMDGEKGITIRVSSGSQTVTVDIVMPKEGVAVTFSVSPDRATEIAEGLLRAARAARLRVEWGKN